VAIVPDSSKAFVACTATNEVAVIQLANDKEPSDKLLTLLDVGKTPIDVLVKPDGGEVFVCNFDSSSVSEIIANSNEVNGTFLIGDHPVRGLVSPDNSLLFVSNFGSDSVAVYNIDNGRRAGAVGVGSNPEAMAFSPNQLRLLVVDTKSNDLAVLELTDRKGNPRTIPVLETMVPLGSNPRAIVVKAFVSQK